MTKFKNPYCTFQGCDSYTEGGTNFCATHNKQQRDKIKNDLKPTKERIGIQKVGTTNNFESSDGIKYSEQQIRRKLKHTYNMMGPFGYCSAYPNVNNFSEVIDHDHTIAKARCKQLHKTELIWDEGNIEFSSRTAHKEWESYKNGLFTEHANFEKRMAFVKKHDMEGWEKRMIIVNAMQRPKQTI